MTSLNPTMTIGAQIAEAILVHQPKMKKEAVQKRVLELMELVGIDRPEARAKLYPWNFSGGMRQRSVLAIALASDPAILIADEPTTALDVTIQAQILDLLKEIQHRLGTATILVSHDLGVVARVADRVAVMYARSARRRKSIMIRSIRTRRDFCGHSRHFPTEKRHCTHFPAYRRRLCIRRKATHLPAVMNLRSQLIMSSSRRCSAYQIRIMQRRGCSTRGRRRYGRNWSGVNGQNCFKMQEK